MKSKQFLASEHFWAKKLPQGWRYEFFGDLIKDTIDNRGRTVPTSDFGIPLIATNCISNSSLFPVFKDIRYVSQKTHDEWFRDGHAEPNDIIFVNKGSPGHICLVPDPINFCFAQDMIGLKINHEKINFKYLFAILRTRFMQEQIDAFHVGTLIPHFKKSDFNSIVVPIPPKKLEDVVGEYYFSISQKIEKLENQNDTLEQMSQAIFQSWFVDFDGVTEFEDSELGQIPKGWSCEILDNFLERITYGFTCPMPTSESGPYMITAKDLKGNKINYESARKTTQDAFQNKLTDKSRPKYNDILLSKDGTLGRVAIVKNEKICINQSIALLQPNSRITTNYLYNLLVNPFYQQKIITDSDGSTIQHIYITRVNKMFIVLPTIQILNKFENLCHGIFTKIEYNRKNIIHLTKTRDALLPKLMSGEIRV